MSKCGNCYKSTTATTYKQIKDDGNLWILNELNREQNSEQTIYCKRCIISAFAKIPNKMPTFKDQNVNLDATVDDDSGFLEASSQLGFKRLTIVLRLHCLRTQYSCCRVQ